MKFSLNFLNRWENSFFNKYSDGSSEEAEETGRGATGETYYTGKDSGDTYVD